MGKDFVEIHYDKKYICIRENYSSFSKLLFHMVIEKASKEPEAKSFKGKP